MSYLHTFAPLSLVGCAIAEGFSAYYAKVGRLDLSRSYLATLRADGIRIDGSLVLREAVVRGHDFDGAVRLVGAHVGMQFSAESITVTNSIGPALYADGLRVDDTLALESANMRGKSKRGTVRLINAQVANEVNGRNAIFVNDIGPALHAEGIRVGSTVNLFEATARGNDARGAIRLLGAHIGGQLLLEAVHLANDIGPALQAEQTHVGGFLKLDSATVHGGGEFGVIILSSAKIGTTLSFVGLRVESSSPLLFDLARTQVEGVIHSLQEVVCSDPSGGDVCMQSGQVDLNELTYSTLGQESWQQWLHLISAHTKNYRPQPYQQLAAIERAAGHDGNARQVLIAQQDDRYHRTPSAIGGRWTRSVYWTWGRLAGYGYRTRTLALILLIALIAASLAGYIAGQIPTRPGHHAAERVVSPSGATTALGTRCSTVELIGLGVDRGLPLGATGLRAKCDLDTSTRRGQVLTLLMWIIQAMLWGLITLAIAGYTNLIRKTP
ncbi:hypothetical protein ACWEFJ_01370 [Actinosynnema sp. NPDC004786]